MRLTILLLLLLNQPSPDFQLNIQHGGSPFDKSEDKGAIDYLGFMKLLDTYPWLNEIEKSNATRNSAPTITVRYSKGMKDLWVSMSGDKTTGYGYLVGYDHNKRVNGKTVKWVEIYLPDDTRKVQQLFGLFFEKEFDALEKALSHLEKFKEMEAQTGL